MFQPSAKRFFLYGLLIAGLEEFVTQGLLKDSCFLWIFTLIPFACFLLVAGCLRLIVNGSTTGRRAAALYYLYAGTVGLAVEWFIIGLAPWNDRTSPPLLIVAFHAGMFSFWGTVALGPHILLDVRAEAARPKRRFAIALAALMAATYAAALAAKLGGAGTDAQFLACVGPVVVTFLAMNVFHVQYFFSYRPSEPLIAPLDKRHAER
jgi:hypothetical protein